MGVGGGWKGASEKQSRCSCWGDDVAGVEARDDAGKGSLFLGNE
jgi:hypothetical protein